MSASVNFRKQWSTSGTSWKLNLTLPSRDSLFDLIESRLGASVKLVVYNSVLDCFREVVLNPSREWGGRGSIGCDIGYGPHHRIPRRAPADRPLMAASLSTPPPPPTGDPEKLKPSGPVMRIIAPGPLSRSTAFRRSSLSPDTEHSHSHAHDHGHSHGDHHEQLTVEHGDMNNLQREPLAGQAAPAMPAPHDGEGEKSSHEHRSHAHGHEDGHSHSLGGHSLVDETSDISAVYPAGSVEATHSASLHRDGSSGSVLNEPLPFGSSVASEKLFAPQAVLGGDLLLQCVAR
ncbi:GRASP55/65 PDZ-like domain-containing protein [Zopfochytrium polystomum]|nr:GRASP55/65 PDZ-like domain-containing protein [Zopfochytrium polystomum]